MPNVKLKNTKLIEKMKQWNELFENYQKARNYFILNYVQLIELEKYIMKIVVSDIKANLDQITRDYNEASYLFPFWENYPPDDRGNKPKKDQYPWIEVGEHVVGTKFSRLLAKNFSIRDTGFPSGSDERFVLANSTIQQITNQFTGSVWLFIDIKSVGPRDDQEHTVMSHNQVSGDGIWLEQDTGLVNTILKAIGLRASHDFHVSLPPIFVLSDGTIAPLINLAVKPVYKMLSAQGSSTKNSGQPLARIDVACIPNGLLLTQSPNYLQMYQSLLFHPNLVQ